jgi:hypothetical protein
MKKHGMRDVVSRRNFLKGVGGSAVTTAIISAGLSKPAPVEAAAPDVKTIADIKRKGRALRWTDVEHIRKRMEEILKELADQNLGAKQINLRLNRSGEDEKKPYFIDWYATKEIVERLEKKAGKFEDIRRNRFGDDEPAAIYDEAVDKAPKAKAERDWLADCGKLVQEKKVGSKLLAPKVGLMYQRFIGIIADDQKRQRRCVGTIGVGFETKPDKDALAKVDKTLEKWASWPPNEPSLLVKDMVNVVGLSFGGPKKP